MSSETPKEKKTSILQILLEAMGRAKTPQALMENLDKQKTCFDQDEITEDTEDQEHCFWNQVVSSSFTDWSRSLSFDVQNAIEDEVNTKLQESEYEKISGDEKDEIFRTACRRAWANYTDALLEMLQRDGYCIECAVIMSDLNLKGVVIDGKFIDLFAPNHGLKLSKDSKYILKSVLRVEASIATDNAICELKNKKIYKEKVERWVKTKINDRKYAESEIQKYSKPIHRWSYYLKDENI